MTSRNGQPQRGPDQRQPPKLPPRSGSPSPHHREDITAAEVFLSPEAVGTVKTGSMVTPVAFQRAPGASSTVAEGGNLPCHDKNQVMNLANFIGDRVAY